MVVVLVLVMRFHLSLAQSLWELNDTLAALFLAEDTPFSGLFATFSNRAHKHPRPLACHEVLCYIIGMQAHHHHGEPKLSRNQSEILSCLREAKAPMSAYAILDRVRTAGISHPPTVYRALNDLIEKGMVHRLQSRSAFIACGHGACDGRFAFAVCRACGRVVEISLTNADQAQLLALAPDEIAPEQVMIEIAGLCEACRSAGKAA